MRMKTCKICKNKFTPVRQLQPTCEKFDCMVEYSNKHLAKQKKEKTKESNKRKKEFYENHKPTLLKKAEYEVNKYVRLRDHTLPCISCGTFEAKWDAGHYMSAGGHAQLRFYTLNIHKQCFTCNRMKSANLVPYRANLIEKIGQAKVDEIESDKSIRRYEVDYLTKLIRVMKRKNKIMEKRIKNMEFAA